MLYARGVEYLVVGGYAVGYHGFVRATGDLDVFVGLRVEEVVDGLRISFIDRESLLTNKRAAGRPKDLADLEALSSPRQDDGKSGL
jgi:hypothetical protein